MTILVRAPFLAILAGLIAAMGLEEEAGPVLLPVLALLTAAGVLLCSFRREERGQWPLFALVLLLTLLASIRMVCVLYRPLPDLVSVRTEGTVTSVRPWGRTYVAVFDTPQGRFLLRLPFATVTEGMRLTAEGISRPLRRAVGTGFDEERFWRGYGVTAWLAASRLEPTPEQPWNPHRLR